MLNEKEVEFMEKEIQEIKEKIKHLEYEQLKELKEDVIEMKSKQAQGDLLLKHVIASNDKLGNTMEQVSSTLIEMTVSLKNNNTMTTNVVDTVDNLSKEVSSMSGKFEQKFIESDNKITELGDKVSNMDDTYDKKLNTIDNKSKIDFVLFIKKNWLPLCLGIGALSYVASRFINLKL